MLRDNRFWLALILLATFALYAPSLRNGFAMDDTLVAKAQRSPAAWDRHPMVATLKPIPEYFASHYWQGSFPASDLYRPVTVLSYALVYRWFGRHAEHEAFPQHLVNVLLHVLATLLVYWLIAGFVPGRAPLFAAAAFGLHAVHSEVVAAVVGRAELLAFDLGALALLAWRRGGIASGVVAAVLSFLAFGSKESAVAWPGLLAAVALVGPPGTRARALFRVALVTLPALAAYLVLRAQVVSSVDIAWIANPLATAGPATRILTAIVVLGFGLRLCLLPIPLRADYGPVVFDLVESPFDPVFLLAAAALLAALGVGLWCWRREPMVFLAVAAFFGFTFLTSNLLVPIGTIFGERLLYQPSLGVAFLVAALARRGWLGTWLGQALFGVWLGLGALLILQRNPVWESNESLFLAEVDRSPPSVRMLGAAAMIEMDRNERDVAIRHLERAVELAPGDGVSWGNLGALLMGREEYARAETCLQRALAAPHSSPTSRARDHGNLGGLLKLAGRRDEAWGHLSQALAVDTSDNSLVFVLDALDLAPGRAPDAEVERLLQRGERMVEMETTDVPGKRAILALHRGQLLRRRGRPAEAEQLLRQVWEQSGLVEAGLVVAELLAQRGQTAEARALYLKIANDVTLTADLRAEAGRRAEKL